MKIGVYVGSFNPVHTGHIKIVNYLLSKYLDKVIIVPTGNYWNKNDLVDISKRIEMLKYYESNKIIIDKTNNHLPYTYQVMDNLTKKHPFSNLYLIIGADNVIDLDKWKNYKELLKYNLIIINRNNIDIKYYLDKLNKKDKYIITKKLPNIDISSTMIRQFIENHSFDKLKGKIDGEVLKYIEENNLY